MGAGIPMHLSVSDSGQPATATALGAENEKALISSLNSSLLLGPGASASVESLLEKVTNLCAIPDLLNPSEKVPRGLTWDVLKHLRSVDPDCM